MHYLVTIFNFTLKYLKSKFEVLSIVYVILSFSYQISEVSLPILIKKVTLTEIELLLPKQPEILYSSVISQNHNREKLKKQ